MLPTHIKINNNTAVGFDSTDQLNLLLKLMMEGALEGYNCNADFSIEETRGVLPHIDTQDYFEELKFNLIGFSDLLTSPPPRGSSFLSEAFGIKDDTVFYFPSSGLTWKQYCFHKLEVGEAFLEVFPHYGRNKIHDSELLISMFRNQEKIILAPHWSENEIRFAGSYLKLRYTHLARNDTSFGTLSSSKDESLPSFNINNFPNFPLRYFKIELRDIARPEKPIDLEPDPKDLVYWTPGTVADEGITEWTVAEAYDAAAYMELGYVEVVRANNTVIHLVDRDDNHQLCWERGLFPSLINCCVPVSLAHIKKYIPNKEQ